MVEISKLKEVAARLNQESDSINETIKDIQEQINALNLGLEVWLDRYPLSIGSPMRDGNSIYRWECYLGYIKFNNEWSLVVGREYAKEVFDPSYMEEPEFQTQEAKAPTLLLKESRQIRLKALEKIEHLVDALKDEAEKSLRAIEKAKAIAEKVSPHPRPAAAGAGKQRALGGPAFVPGEIPKKAILDPVKALDEIEKTKKAIDFSLGSIEKTDKNIRRAITDPVEALKSMHKKTEKK